MAKTATTINQSEALMEAGIPASAADMKYVISHDGCYELCMADAANYWPGIEVPAYSLSALMDLLPKTQTVNGHMCGLQLFSPVYGLEPQVDKDKYVLGYSAMLCSIGDNLLDAAFGLLMKINKSD